MTQREVSTAAALESSLNSEKITNIVLDNNITIAEKALTIDAEQEKVIDVNGHTITVAEGIVNNGNLTIKDSKQVSTPIMRVMNAVKKITTSDELEKSGIIVESTKDHAIKNEKGAELTIEGGYYDAKENGKAALYNEGKVTVKGGTFTRSLENSNSNTWYTVVNHGEMVIEGGKFENVGNYSSMLINGYASDKDYTEETENPTLEIKGGTFTGGLNTIKNDEIGILTIKSEESKAAPVFENNNQAVLMNWNVTTIEGGTFNYGGKDSIIINGKRDKKPNYEKGELTITGGTFTATQDAAKFAKKQATASAGDVTISDGVLFKGQKATYTEE